MQSYSSQKITHASAIYVSFCQKSDTARRVPKFCPLSKKITATERLLDGCLLLWFEISYFKRPRLRRSASGLGS